MNSDYDTFPAQVYADSVLAPDLDIYKQHFSAPLHAINLAHGVMLAEQGLLQPADSAAILAALLKIDKDRKALLERKSGGPEAGKGKFTEDEVKAMQDVD